MIDLIPMKKPSCGNAPALVVVKRIIDGIIGMLSVIVVLIVLTLFFSGLVHLAEWIDGIIF